MKIVLVEPPAINQFGSLRTLGSIGSFKSDICWPPLDLMIIAGMLRKNGLEPKIYDANSLRAGLSEVGRFIANEKPGLVIFTTSTPTIYKDLEVAVLAKSISKDIYTVVTSTHINALPKEALELCGSLDFTLANDYELSLIDLIKNNFNPQGLPGITYRNGAEIIQNGFTAATSDINQLGFPAHDLIPLDIYKDPFMRRRPMTVTYTSRGCVNTPACSMCSACFYDKLRQRSVHNVMEELRWIKSLDIKEVRFPFESGFNDSAFANQLFDAMIKEKLDINFTCNGRADMLSPGLLNKMKEAGCMAVNIGCETTNPETLAFVNKRVNPEQVMEAVKNVKKAGMDALVYFIYGLPFETMASMKRTLKFAKSLNADLVTFGTAIPHPGTVFYEYLNKNGYLATKEWDKYDPMFTPPYSYPDLSGNEIYKFAKNAYRSFYLRPKFILRRLVKFNIAEDFRNFIGFIKRYLN